MPTSRQKSGKKISVLWLRWKRRGMVEIMSGHRRWTLTNCVRIGLEKALADRTHVKPIEELTKDDYEDIRCKRHTETIDKKSQQSFEFATYAGEVFATLRNIINISEDEYLNSVTPMANRRYLEFISNSKSGQDFFLTPDKRFMIKTQTKKETYFFLEHLRTYVEHFKKYPHTLMVKFLGLHNIKLKGKKRLYFIVMQSIFYPDERIRERYDIKACQASRYVLPEKDGSQIITVLKDNNFGDNKINLGSNRAWFLQQVQADTELLEELGVLDYSLLVGITELHSDEKNSQDLASLVQRVTKSLHHGSPEKSANNPKSAGSTLHEEISHSAATLPVNGVMGSLPGMVDSVDEPPPDPNAGTERETDPGAKNNMIPNIPGLNRRLLPNTPNSLHIVDGEEYRYFLGIIDFFVTYGLKKKLENLWKKIRFPGQSFSTVPPEEYAERFRKYMAEHSE
ncbi:PREDICTED: phosphatidylinositol 4-phosphate 5-kinase-like protein 1 isoform X2 [Branchiostoma belcheri]|uniref:Phosphatidylinositol 4-phosphate 5-kinase-like protein 1 isoform X2 n=1 Tax=Branchiostoma belcheri TaxID=7741 RepID=A0A6P4ZV60_BRABE|nr:PREDICTED: phosphatidylinositol 4-phosphate 5-kinase-like protein 1 isoform X2 [Branchiostoma belcheri]